MDKFNMSREQSIFLAKRNIVDYVWKSANLEGISVTFPETDAIINGANVSHLKVDEIITINNLKHAWYFLLDNLDYPLDFKFICKVNQHVGEHLFYGAGYIRKLPVRIGGTKWVPPVPESPKVDMVLSEILEISNVTEKSIKLMLYLMRSQLFLDGNKRTAMLSANQIMISQGCGIITIEKDKQTEFYKLLIDYYETGDDGVIFEFISNRCIDGVDFTLQDNLIHQGKDWDMER